MGFRSIDYWLKDNSYQNFGDYLSDYFVEKLFLFDLDNVESSHVIGSVISREWIEAHAIRGGNNKINFWCCGARDSKPISSELIGSCRFLGARGPLTRDVLGLKKNIPIGDPGLLLPAVYPSSDVSSNGKYIVVPHILERLSKKEIIAKTGADNVLWPGVLPGSSSIEDFVDELLAAEFVLCGALHAAIIRAAYDKPFAYWGGGYINCPFKWDDFSESIKIKTKFFSRFDQAKKYYDTNQSSIRIPPLSLILAICPFWIRPNIGLKAFAIDAERHGLDFLGMDYDFESLEDNLRSGQLIIDMKRVNAKQAEAKAKAELIDEECCFSEARQQQELQGPTNLALLSPWACRCGIAEYSFNLLRSIEYTSTVQLQVYCDDRTQTPPAGADVCWTLGDTNSVLSALKRMGQRSINVAFVQHQPGLFTLSDDICTQLAVLSRLGKVVILELHATLPLVQDVRLSHLAISALKNIDRIIVHTPKDLNNLLSLGLANNVMMLHHGVVRPLAKLQIDVARAELGIAADALVLGSFGFALEHKGIDTLIRSITPLANACGRVVNLIALHSILDKRSEDLIPQYQALATQLGVADQVHWITDYQPIESCQRFLGIADFIVFPYKYSSESASGAVTIGLSTLKPVLVTPIDIFSDLSDITWTMDGHDVFDIVRAVQAIQAQPDIVMSQIDRQHDWVGVRDWDCLSARLISLMSSLRLERNLPFEFSLVIASLQDDADLGECLQSLTALDDPFPFEVIVVDRNDDDRLTGVIDSFRALLEIQHIRVNFRNASRARNIGAKRATGRWLGFSDEDCRFLPDVLTQVACIAVDTGAQLITGQITHDAGSRNHIRWPADPSIITQWTMFNFASEAAMFFDRECFLSVGGFDERFGPGARFPAAEDLDLMNRLFVAMDSSFAAYHSPLVRMYHPNKMPIWNRGMVSRFHSDALGLGALISKSPSLHMLYGGARELVGSLLRTVFFRGWRSKAYGARIIGLLKGFVAYRSEQEGR